MNKITAVLLLSTSSLYAGTPGNSDVTILYGIAMAILAIMFGIDCLIKFIRNRKAKNQMERLNDINDHLF